MKCTIPEISWHNRDPVLSVDIQVGTVQTVEGEVSWRLATGGADSHVLIWHLKLNDIGGIKVTHVADLERHQKAVNVVRFSPSGEILASGDDESIIILWKQKEDSDTHLIIDTENQNKEQWNSWKVLRGHIEDVYDISWSPDSNSLISGSVDNTAILWDIQKGRSIGILSDHKGFVQGVSWDPCNQYVCTLSTDRQCRLIDINTKKTIQRISKAKIPTPPGHPLEGKTVRLFHDDTFKSFFRRLTFSLDGAMIIAPSGIIEPQDSTEKLSHATIVFSRHNLKEPIMILPSLDQCTIAVRCCPLYFELQDDGPVSMVALPYRMVFAVATQSSVLIYDTQQISPIAVISNIHYTRLTDIAWSSNGKILVVSSTDGYCSMIYFQEGELGKVYKNRTTISFSNAISSYNKESSKPKKNNTDRKKELFLDLDSNAMDIDISIGKPEIITENTMKLDKSSKEFKEQVVNDRSKALTANKVINEVNEYTEETEDIKLVYTEEISSENVKRDSKKTPPKLTVPLITLNRTPRRIRPITLSSPKRTKKE